MDGGSKSGFYFFIELLLGVLLGVVLLNYIAISASQMNEINRMSNIFCVVVGSVGALLKEQKYASVRWVGRKMLSVAIMVLGLGILVMIKFHTAN